MTTIRWGILSTADIARKKVIPGLLKARRCEVVAIASRDAATARRVAGELDIPVAHGSYEALLADPAAWTRCTSRCRTTSMPNGPSPPPGPASTSCARSR